MPTARALALVLVVALMGCARRRNLTFRMVDTVDGLSIAELKVVRMAAYTSR